MMTGYGDISIVCSRDETRRGEDFLSKPFNDQAMLDAVMSEIRN